MADVPSKTDNRPVWLDQYIEQTGDNAEYHGELGAPIGVLSIANKQWTPRFRKDEATVLEADDSPARSIAVVIVKGTPTMTKTYYGGVYAPGAKDAPSCFSLDGVRPAANVTHQEAPLCGACPKNQFGTKGKGKACQDQRRLAVLWDDDLENERFNGPMLLRITPATFPAWTTYLTEMDRAKRPLHAMVTHLSFVQNVPHPQIIFKPGRWLELEELQRILEWRGDPYTDRVVSMLDLPRDDLGYEPGTTALPAPPPTTAAKLSEREAVLEAARTAARGIETSEGNGALTRTPLAQPDKAQLQAQRLAQMKAERARLAKEQAALDAELAQAVDTAEAAVVPSPLAADAPPPKGYVDTDTLLQSLDSDPI